MRTIPFVLAAVAALNVFAFADEKSNQSTPSKLPLCPVMGEAIDLHVKANTESGPVFMCCPPCIRKYNSDPAFFEAKVKEQRAVLAKMDKVQVLCPVSGQPIDPKVSAAVAGQTVHFCCAKCVAAYEKEPARYAGKLASAYTYQVKCPVEGAKVDATAFVDLSTGERVYLCCKACGEKLTGDPAKYAPALAEQGVNLDVKKLKKPA